MMSSTNVEQSPLSNRNGSLEFLLMLLKKILDLEGFIAGSELLLHHDFASEKFFKCSFLGLGSDLLVDNLVTNFLRQFTFGQIKWLHSCNMK